MSACQNTPLSYYKAHRAAVSMMAKGCILAGVLPLRCFLFYYPNIFTIYAIRMPYCKGIDKKGVLPHE